METAVGEHLLRAAYEVSAAAEGASEQGHLGLARRSLDAQLAVLTGHFLAEDLRLVWLASHCASCRSRAGWRRRNPPFDSRSARRFERGAKHGRNERVGLDLVDSFENLLLLGRQSAQRAGHARDEGEVERHLGVRERAAVDRHADVVLETRRADDV